MKITFLPQAKTGWWSLGLIVAMPLLFAVGTTMMNIFYPSVPAGETIVADIFARPGLALSMLAGMGAGIAAFVTGVIAVARKKEGSLLVFISTIIGALLILFLAGEFIWPH